jgi:putative PIN family toxin of toxin-antitoxin system
VRILLDTNVIISGLLSSAGPPGQLMQGWLDGAFELVTSPAQLEELRWALRYERVRDRIHPDQARDIVENMEVAAIVVLSVGEVNYSSDPGDNMILAAAIAGRADLIVSGDKPGMLNLGEVEGIRIVTPRAALGLLEGSMGTELR